MRSRMRMMKMAMRLQARKRNTLTRQVELNSIKLDYERLNIENGELYREDPKSLQEASKAIED